MKRLLFAILAMVMTMGIMAEDQFVNLTPRPKSITVGTGVWTMPQSLTVGTGQLAEEYVAEAKKFAEVVKTATGRDVKVSATTKADIVLKLNSAIKNEEGYKVTVTTSGITAEASTATGLFYALQTIKKIMPLNVMAGVYDPEVKEFTAPVCTIDDEPRFEYRGFMLDVSRHFFPVEQIKRMIDVMAYYKLNKFHWHLTDDQGWRIEIKKYPKLCTVGATRDFSYEVDPVYGRYQTYEPYGPFFYTQEEAKEIVAYAANLHIEVIPEVDMPGHFVAAMTAYPEFSCTPNGGHSVWTDGGISSDILNVANPQAVQFTKDIMTELAEVFPSRHFHIGGDECPTSAWENNADCQALYKELKLTSYRALQSHFIKQMDEHAKSLGKHLFMWNESISANGADQTIIQNTGATIMCWTNPYAAALTASQRGLDVIITPWGPYYINRVQSTDPGEPVGAGNGADTAERTYNEVPVPSNVPAAQQKYYKGVQGTFWCEHVGTRYLLEYLALPRLICVAEAGWTPQNLKNWEHFKKRWNEDYKMLDYRGYYYGKHFIEKKNDDGSSNSKVMPKDGAYYRIVTTATDAARVNACIEVLPEGSSKIGTGNAQAYRLWQMPQAAEGASDFDYQWFTFELDPNGSGLYAMVCRALPDGSVNPTPTATNNTGRFDYDRTKKHYAWELGTHTYGKMANGHYKYTIHSNKQPSNMYVNAAAGGQQYSVNQWSDPADGNGGIWEFVPAVEEVEPGTEPINAPWIEEGSIVRIENAIKTGVMLYADDSNNLRNANNRLTANAWEIVKYGDISEDGGSRTVQLKNVFTGKYIGNVGVTPVTMSASATNITLTYDTVNTCWNLNRIVPIGADYKTNAGCMAHNGVYPQGAAWKMSVATPITISCVDVKGNPIVSYNSSLAAGEVLTEEMLPTIKNHRLKDFYSMELEEGDVIVQYVAQYERVACSISLVGTDSRGIILVEQEETINMGDTYTVAWPEYEFGTLASTESADGTTITPTTDMALAATYTCEGVMGFAAVGNRVDKVEKNRAYLIYNAMPTDASRTGFLHTEANRALWLARGATEGDPSYVWTTTGGVSSTKFGNDVDMWVGDMKRGTNMYAVSDKSKGATFTVSKVGDGTFHIKDSKYYWNANSGGGFTGWDDGHPYEFYTLKGHPYYYINVTTILLDEQGSETKKTTVSTLVKGGEDASDLAKAAEKTGYDAPVIEGTDGIDYVKANLNVTITYQKTSTGINTVSNNANDAAYDLTGRRTTKQSRGIVIQNNEKRVKVEK